MSAEELLNQGIELHTQGRLHEALQQYDRTIAAAQDEVRWQVLTYYYRGMVHYRWQQYEQAIADFSVIVDRHDEVAADVVIQALLMRAECYGAREEYAAAVADYTAMLSDPAALPAPLLTDTLLFRGGAYERLEEYDLAIKDLQAFLNRGDLGSAELERAQDLLEKCEQNRQGQ
ncbi:Tetratricopeptide repeat protein [Gimesia panareensis]|uniref:Tetratricopeptide repeat protein n=1 Tax=Gimesia panareensis TaxID=2527978 RepID=A0A517Q0F2_9PLAN|nr:tetratricopeptide repeat protein [Gimesia panareensis]QDT25101.1 Tetratricopeptide repeat protein [Gimesia panareensis]